MSYAIDPRTVCRQQRIVCPERPASSPHNTEYVGNYGSGSFTQSGGTNTVLGSLLLGEYAGSAGTYSLNGGLL